MEVLLENARSITHRGIFMSLRKPKKIAKRENYSPEKEKDIKGLIGIFSHFGFHVRREELKRGLGWRVQSGVCKVEKNSFIFLERRSSQEDQIAFLIRNIQELIKHKIPDELLSSLSQEIKDPLTEECTAPIAA